MNGSEGQARLLTMMKTKDNIETEILAIVDELSSPGANGQTAVGLKGNLVDKDGFPRNDIDIMRITTLRNRHAVLNTDLANLMKEIEAGLHQLHSSVKSTKSTDASREEMWGPPFLLVKEVMGSSPAESAGIKEGDVICRFGKLNGLQFNEGGFSRVAEQVVEEQPIRIWIKRGENKKTFTLIPKRWSGRGLLGCHLVKYE